MAHNCSGCVVDCRCPGGLDPVTDVATLLLWVCGSQLAVPVDLCTPAGTGKVDTHACLRIFILDCVPYIAPFSLFQFSIPVKGYLQNTIHFIETRLQNIQLAQ